MTDTICVIIPVLGRPDRAAVVAESVHRASRPTTAVVFVCSPGDDAEIAACHQTGATMILAPFEAGPGDYARKINLAARTVQADWFFTGADDLEFTPGWDAKCLATAYDTPPAVPLVMREPDENLLARKITHALVVGTNDDCNVLTADGRHSTHSLVHALAVEAGTVDAPNLILHEGYDHQFVDTELVATAKARGVYAHAADAIVRHHHPMRRRAAMDDTYRKGQKQSVADARLFRRRRPLWDRRPA